MATREILDHYGKLGYISREDLENLRVVTGRMNVAGSGNPCYDADQAFSAFHRSWTFHEDLRRRYGIDPDEAVGFSLFDGAILESEAAEDQ